MTWHFVTEIIGFFDYQYQNTIILNTYFYWWQWESLESLEIPQKDRFLWVKVGIGRD